MFIIIRMSYFWQTRSLISHSPQLFKRPMSLFSKRLETFRPGSKPLPNTFSSSIPFPPFMEVIGPRERSWIAQMSMHAFAVLSIGKKPYSQRQSKSPNLSWGLLTFLLEQVPSVLEWRLQEHHSSWPMQLKFLPVLQSHWGMFFWPWSCQILNSWMQVTLPRMRKQLFTTSVQMKCFTMQSNFTVVLWKRKIIQLASEQSQGFHPLLNLGPSI